MYFDVSQEEADGVEGKEDVVTSYVPATRILTQIEHITVRSKEQEPDPTMMEHC